MLPNGMLSAVLNTFIFAHGRVLLHMYDTGTHLLPYLQAGLTCHVLTTRLTRQWQAAAAIASVLSHIS